MEDRLSCRDRLSPRFVHSCLYKSWKQGRPAADSEHLLLCTAAPVANKFYGAMAWLGSYSFCKPTTGNMQSKMHMCIFFDIHREHSCLLSGARGVGMREMILQSPQLSPQSAFEEIWIIDMIFSAILA